MKKIIGLMTVLMMCVALACPAAAAENTFVPSISYKDAPEVDHAELDGEKLNGCVVVTSIPAAQEKTTDIYQEDRDLLLEVYEKLESGEMKLPLEGSYVIRELVDVSFVRTNCVEADHGHKQWLAQEDTAILVDFEMNVDADTELTVLTYIDGEWAEVKSVTNNGNGTVTVEFEDFCPVAFCVPGAQVQTASEEGGMPVLLMAAVAGLVIVILLLLRKKSKKEEK